jgi:hypothetical protein
MKLATGQVISAADHQAVVVDAIEAVPVEPETAAP